MENHPIPQDVTGFKFKLIGSMTVKQFLYILGFGILATIVFVLNINFFIRVPIMLLLAGIGCALAFVPIEGRPMDVMIANFAKTIPSENRYIFKKRGVDIASHELFKSAIKPAPIKAPVVAQTKPNSDPQASDKRALLISRLRNSSFRPDDTEVKTLNNIHQLFDNGAQQVVASVAPLPSAPQEDKSAAEERMNRIDQEIAEEKRLKEAAQIVQPASQPAEPSPQIKLGGNEAPHSLPTVAAPKPIGQTPNPALSTGFPTLPDVGNVVMGMVCDPRKKSLPNILVEVLDVNGIPVRTFKTNALGQFASATPLPNGSYRVHFEDSAKQHEFADVNITLAGEIFQPLQISSTDAREKLRQELFGGVPAAAA